MKKFTWSLPLAVGAVVVAATTSAFAETTPFTDINQSFAKQAIIQMHNQGIADGYDDGTFQPDKPITRAEFATMLLKAKKFPTTDAFDGFFRDVQRGEWYAPYAELSYRLGVTSGVNANDFDPNGYLTREQMVRMTVNALGKESETARHMSYEAYSTALRGYLDKSQISSWAVKPIAYAVNTGMIQGAYGQMNPQDLATRAEVAAFLGRSVMKKPKGQSLVPVSRGELNYNSKHDVTATAYTYDNAYSYIGLEERKGMVAVDPSQITLGSHVYIPGYGYGIAGDTGGAIKNQRVDLFYTSEWEANQFGRKGVNVFVLD